MVRGWSVGYTHDGVGYWDFRVSLRAAADRAEQVEEALVLVEIDKLLTAYVNGLGDRGHFDAVQAAPGSSAEVPDEAGGGRPIVLGINQDRRPNPRQTRYLRVFVGSSVTPSRGPMM